MVIPIALAVLRLIERVNFVGSCTGRSVGLAPFRILSTYTALLRNSSSALNVYDSRPPASPVKVGAVHVIGNRYLIAKSAALLRGKVAWSTMASSRFWLI